MLDPNLIEALLRGHASSVVNANKESDHIAIDGKSLRGSKRLDSKCLHSVSAWCNENSIVLGEVPTGAKSNEITAIPLLLEAIDVKGKTITIDKVKFKVDMHIPRCSATNLKPDTDINTINLPLQIKKIYNHSDMGVYLKPEENGLIKENDKIYF